MILYMDLHIFLGHKQDYWDIPHLEYIRADSLVHDLYILINRNMLVFHQWLGIVNLNRMVMERKDCHSVLVWVLKQKVKLSFWKIFTKITFMHWVNKYVTYFLVIYKVQMGHLRSSLDSYIVGCDWQQYN